MRMKEIGASGSGIVEVKRDFQEKWRCTSMLAAATIRAH